MKLVKTFFKKIISVIVIVTTAILSFFLISSLTKEEEEETVDRLKGRNDILDKNSIKIGSGIDSLNNEIKIREENISKIKEEKNNEELDSFFDKRGF